MLKKLNLLIVLASVVGLVVFLVAMGRGEEHGGIRVRGKTIEINGDYTLASLAEEVNDPTIFSYDKDKRLAVAKASLLINGSLTIGHPTDEELGETLQLDTVVCGDLRVQVARGGTLTVRHSTISTFEEIMTLETCSKGYALIVDGTLDVADSDWLFMSGTRSETARRYATVRLRDVRFLDSDGTAFRCVAADGARLEIEDSKFWCEGQYGFIVKDSGGAPIQLRGSRLHGTAADLQLMGRNPKADLVDCLFSKSKVKFYQRGGRVTIRWTVTAKVVEKGSGKPMAGVEVLASSTGAEAAETVRGRTGDDGTCALVLTEYVATAGLPTRHDGSNNVTPHRIVAQSADGKVLVELAAYNATSTGGTITLEVLSSALSSLR